MYSHILTDESGRILGMGESPHATIPVETLLGISPDTHWYNWETRTVVERAPMPLAVDGADITGIPCLCRCVIVGPVMMEFQVNPPGATLSFDAPGDYELTIEPTVPRWLPSTVTLTVGEA